MGLDEDDRVLMIVVESTVRNNCTALHKKKNDEGGEQWVLRVPTRVWPCSCDRYPSARTGENNGLEIEIVIMIELLRAQNRREGIGDIRRGSWEKHDRGTRFLVWSEARGGTALRRSLTEANGARFLGGTCSAKFVPDAGWAEGLGAGSSPRYVTMSGEGGGGLASLRSGNKKEAMGRIGWEGGTSKTPEGDRRVTCVRRWVVFWVLGITYLGVEIIPGGRKSGSWGSRAGKRRSPRGFTAVICYLGCCRLGFCHSGVGRGPDRRNNVRVSVETKQNKEKMDTCAEMPRRMVASLFVNLRVSNSDSDNGFIGAMVWVIAVRCAVDGVVVWYLDLRLDLGCQGEQLVHWIRFMEDEDSLCRGDHDGRKTKALGEDEKREKENTNALSLLCNVLEDPLEQGEVVWNGDGVNGSTYMGICGPAGDIRKVGSLRDEISNDCGWDGRGSIEDDAEDSSAVSSSVIWRIDSKVSSVYYYSNLQISKPSKVRLRVRPSSDIVKLNVVNPQTFETLCPGVHGGRKLATFHRIWNAVWGLGDQGKTGRRDESGSDTDPVWKADSMARLIESRRGELEGLGVVTALAGLDEGWWSRTQVADSRCNGICRESDTSRDMSPTPTQSGSGYRAESKSGTRRDDPRDPPDSDGRCWSMMLMVDASNEVLRCAYCRACEESDADIDEQGAVTLRIIVMHIHRVEDSKPLIYQLFLDIVTAHRVSDAELKLEAYGARPTRGLGPRLARPKASEALKQKARQAGEQRVNGRTKNRENILGGRAAPFASEVRTEDLGLSNGEAPAIMSASSSDRVPNAERLGLATCQTREAGDAVKPLVRQPRRRARDVFATCVRGGPYAVYTRAALTNHRESRSLAVIQELLGVGC
ncbi:hypothetical protein PLEOSDRAFT_168791 [Pleurotus ostreatus PC15]|uniref:Uncharacterized protein n=1 Tax=Pleurotus ostreatus (strain PC15) TaxID=1137138 RepID=A0A067NGF8_PLEO1|nr:hypothetical protein PLEOSDRAFT_168791 [Pleurotus ostreatus PC15]